MSGGQAISPARALVAIVLCGVLLRLQISAVGPIIPAIQADLGGTFFQLGLLTTVPVILLGFFALVAVRVAARLGTFLAITVSLVMITSAALLRAGGNDVTVLVLATIPIGIGTGIGGALASAVIKETQSHRPARAAGAHVAGLIGGSGLAAAVVVPISNAFDTWRAGLFVIAVGSVVGTIGWIILTRAARGTRPVTGGPTEIAWLHPGTWVIVLLFSLQALIFWGVSTWIATAYQEIGWTPTAAGLLASLLNASPLFGAIWISGFGDRFGSRRRNLAVASVLVLVGTTLIAGLPDLAAAGAVLTGAGLGALFALTMTLPLDVARSAREAAGLTGLTFVIGFGSAAVTPMILGALADLTGSFTLSLWTMVGAAALMLLGSRSTAYLRMGSTDESEHAPVESGTSGPKPG
jgi:MFS transporter, CP family, cyanate transporter